MKHNIIPLVKSRLIIPILLLLFVFCACRTQRHVQTEYVYIERNDSLKHLSQRIDSLLRETTKRDSIHEKDSVAVVIKGDTVMIDRWHTVYKESSNYNSQKEKEIIHDTIYQTHTEYIDRYIEKEVIQEVNKLYWWQKTLMWIGGIGLGFTIILVLVAIFTIRKWIKGE